MMRSAQYREHLQAYETAQRVAAELEFADEFRSYHEPSSSPRPYLPLPSAIESVTVVDPRLPASGRDPELPAHGWNFQAHVLGDLDEE